MKHKFLLLFVCLQFPGKALCDYIPNKSDSLVIEGLEYYKAADYQTALDRFDSALRFNPEEALFFTLRGIAKIALGRYQESLEDFDRSLVLRPGEIEPRIYKGIALYKLHRYQAAINYFNQVIDGYPGFFCLAYRYRGRILEQRGERQEAALDLALADRIEGDYLLKLPF